jgi:hypothetical protein
LGKWRLWEQESNHWRAASAEEMIPVTPRWLQLSFLHDFDGQVVHKSLETGSIIHIDFDHSWVHSLVDLWLHPKSI